MKIIITIIDIINSQDIRSFIFGPFGPLTLGDLGNIGFKNASGSLTGT